MNKLKKDGRKLRSESTADLILNTALKIVRKGDIDISFDAIAKEAKIGTRTIFRHFKDKEALQENLDQVLAHEFTNAFLSIDREDHLEKRIKNLSTVLISTLHKKSKYSFVGLLRTFGETKPYEKICFLGIKL